MKKSLFVVALATLFVFALGAVAFAAPSDYPGITGSNQSWNNLFSGPYNPGYSSARVADPDRPGEDTFSNAAVGLGFRGYLKWDDAPNDPELRGGRAWSGDNSNSPHGNYATTTNKCAVCHSVHKGAKGGSVLTAWAGIDTATAKGGSASNSSCIFCHGQNATFTSVRVNTQTYSIDPHSACYRCHVVSPHGAGASVYPVLRQKLLAPIGDAAIANDITNVAGVTDAMFDLSDPDLVAAGTTLGTGYLCASSGTSCHRRSAFAVAEAGHTPYGSFLDGAFSASNPQFTGHRVLATATDTWDAATYGAAASNITKVAWAPASSCRACHDAQTWWGTDAFPHNYVDEDGESIAKGAESSYIWLTTASNAGGADKEILKGTRASADTTHNAEPLTRDGLCLKCHVKDAGKTAGVGITY